MTSRLIPAMFLAVLLSGFAWAIGSERQSRDYPFDPIITDTLVVPFSEFEALVHHLVPESGISAEILGRVLSEFEKTNSRRVIPYAEWRLYFLESLYRNGIPYPYARRFLEGLGDRCARAVDTGFLEEARTTRLGNRIIYKLQDDGVDPPRPVEDPLPRYTDYARSARAQGLILLKCIILEDGTPTNFHLLRGLGFGLDEAAILTVQNKWRFQPARRDGKPVPFEANIEVSMRLH